MGDPMTQETQPNGRELSSSPEISGLNIGEDLAALPLYKKSGITTVDFDGLLDPPLQLREDLSSGCGGQTWPAGMVLAKHLLRYHREDLDQPRILELGAGGGLVGLAVARGCRIGAPVYVTDQEVMLSLMQHNISLNYLDDKAKAVVLNWGEPLNKEVVDFKPDVVLAADCVYFEPAFPLLLETLALLLALNPSATIYFCFQKRRRADMQFLSKARKKFTVTEIFDEDRPDFAKRSLFLYTFTRKWPASTCAGSRADSTRQK